MNVLIFFILVNCSLSNEKDIENELQGFILNVVFYFLNDEMKESEL